jgi:hypothetical protein
MQSDLETAVMIDKFNQNSSSCLIHLPHLA